MKQFVFISILFIVYQLAQLKETKACFGESNQQSGTIIDTVYCKTHPDLSYALYLPSNYSDTIKWPLICIFEPGARGKLAITNFRQAAENSGYILICSNNSRNGLSWDEYTDIANSLFIDIETKYSIDFDRIYTSGFSGGSRVATYIALNCKTISGVIACGAGFPEIAGNSRLHHFDYFGLVGNRDMNYNEMIGVEEKLTNLGANNELLIFKGDHQWPSSDLLQEATEWLDLQAIKKGSKKMNETFFNSQFAKHKNLAAFLLKQRDLIQSAKYYEYAIKEFPTQPETNQLKETLDSLKNSKDYKKSVKESNNIKSNELEIQYSLSNAFQKHVLMPELPDSVRNWWNGQIKILRNMENGRDALKQMMASRLLNMLGTLCFESGSNYVSSKMFKAAAFCYRLELMIVPENKQIEYLLARVYALDNDSKNSFKSLERAIKLGFTNKQMIENDPAFSPLINDKKFKEIVRQLGEK